MYLIRPAKGDARKPYYPSCQRYPGWTRVSYLGGPRPAKDGEEIWRIGNRMGVRAGVVDLPFAEGAICVDSVNDWCPVEKVFTEGRAPQPQRNWGPAR